MEKKKNNKNKNKNHLITFSVDSEFFQMHIDLAILPSQFLSASSSPQLTHSDPTDSDSVSPTALLRLPKGLSTSRPHCRAGGWGRPEPTATPFPGRGVHLLRAVQAPGQGEHEWDNSRRPECFLSATTHLSPSAWGGLTVLFFLRAHQEVLSQHKLEGARRNHLSSKLATHLILKFKEFTKYMVSFA